MEKAICGKWLYTERLMMYENAPAEQKSQMKKMSQ